MDQFYDKTITTQRLSDVAETDEEEFVENLTGVSCNIQPIDDSFSEDISGNYGQDFLMFCRDNDIKIGDRVIDGTDIYEVVGKERYVLMAQTHIELRIRKK